MNVLINTVLMYCFDRINHIHLNSVLLFLVLLFSGAKSSATNQCIKICHEKAAIVLSSNGSPQEYGLKPLNIQLNSYNPSEQQSSIQQFMTGCDIAQKIRLNIATEGIHFNGHKGTLGIIALLFPFHGFT